MKPHITYWNGLWECVGYDLHSFGHSPKQAYTRWLLFVGRMRVYDQPRGNIDD